MKKIFQRLIFLQLLVPFIFNKVTHTRAYTHTHTHVRRQYHESIHYYAYPINTMTFYSVLARSPDVCLYAETDEKYMSLIQ